ncbi:MAG: hypothetical protein LIO77_03710 [Rikenellaceae bacterium]|nr:hypothetical protein [Rikenellaceae bacterium]
MTLCIEVEQGNEGKTMDLTVKVADGRKFKAGATTLSYKGLVIENDNISYVENFIIEYEDE